MLTQLNGGKDIIALSVGERIEKDEMELAFRLLDEAFARESKAHIFVEVLDLLSIAPDALFYDLRLVLLYLARLKQFDRIANVPEHASDDHTSEIQSLMRTSYAVLSVTKNKPTHL